MSDDWWRGGTIYQIYPRSFQDSNGDGVGDLPGITKRLDHVASLNVDAIWLSPFFTSPMADMGYDVSDYRDVDPVFGTLGDFRALVDRAHELGLKVIIDQVISHSSDQHPWFAESRADRTNPKADWYVWADPQPDGSPPSNWLAVFGGSAWQWDARRRQYYLHNFLKEQPDFNFHNTAVQDAHLDTLRFWMELGVDGFRLDTVNYYFHDQQLRDNGPAPKDETATDNRPPANPYGMQDHVYSKTRPENVAFLERMRAVTDEHGAAMVGEVGDPDWRAIDVMAEYTRGTKRLHMAYSFDMLGNQFTPAFYRKKIEGFFQGAPDGWPCWSFSNHDVRRHVSRWAEHGTSEEAIAKLAISMLASFQGSIGIYQGEELGQSETELEFHELTDPAGINFWPDEKGRDGCRTPMVWAAQAPHGGFTTGTPWLPVKAPQAENAADRQDTDPASVLNHYRAVLAFRKGSEVLLKGDTTFLDAPAHVLAFRRSLGGKSLICLFNLRATPAALTLSGDYAVTGPSADQPDGTALTLSPNGFVWLEDRGGLSVAA